MLGDVNVTKLDSEIKKQTEDSLLDAMILMLYEEKAISEDTCLAMRKECHAVKAG